MHISMKRKAALAFVLSAALALTLFPVSAGAVTAAQKQAEVQSVSAQLNALNEELSLAVDDYNLANRNHDQAVAEAEDCQQRINDAQAKINALQTRIETRATSMYRSGSMTYLDVLMGVGSFDDFATVWDTLNTLNAEDADLVVSSKQAKAELDAAKADLDAKQAEAQRPARDCRVLQERNRVQDRSVPVDLQRSELRVPGASRSGAGSSGAGRGRRKRGILPLGFQQLEQRWWKLEQG